MKIAFLFFLIGFLAGALYGIFKFICHLLKNNIIIQIILDLILSILIGFTFIFATNYYFYGEIRLYMCIIFIIGVYLERKTFGKLFAKLYFILYNVGRKLVNKLNTTRFGKFIFK